MLTAEHHKGDILLKEMGRQLMAECPKGTKIQTAMSELSVLRAVHRLIRDEQADLVVVGVEAGGEDGVVGGQAIALARISTVPVLVVPVLAEAVLTEVLLAEVAGLAVPGLAEVGAEGLVVSGLVDAGLTAAGRD